MRLFGRTPARRLREGPTLLCDASAEELLEAVRRFDPSAEPRSGKIRLRRIDLAGPIELTPELTAKAKLPAGWARAYIADAAAWRLPLTISLVDGLAQALNGRSHHAVTGTADDEWIDPVVSVFLRDPAAQEQIREAVAPFIDPLEVEHDSDGDYYLRGDGHVSIACCTQVLSYAVDLRPPMLDGLFSMECAIFIESEKPSVASDLLHRAGRVALAIAEANGGLVLDINGFEVRRPEHVHLNV